MDLYMLESQVGGKALWERRTLLERPSVQRQIRLRREYELQRRLAARSRPAVWRTTLHRVGDGLIALGERLRAGSAATAANG
jgi:hypothetical protein